MEAVTDLDRLIERRSRQSGEDERPAEASWKASVRRYNARRQEEIRAEWCAYHQQQAARHRRTLAALIDHHEEAARKLMETTGSEPTKGQQT